MFAVEGGASPTLRQQNRQLEEEKAFDLDRANGNMARKFFKCFETFGQIFSDDYLTNTSSHHACLSSLSFWAALNDQL